MISVEQTASSGANLAYLSTMKSKSDILEQQWGGIFGVLAEAYVAGNEAGFNEALDCVVAVRQEALYRDLREMSDNLRFALDQFRLDSRLATLAGKEVPDARVRLDHVLKLTEEGAHRTLDLVERSCPLADRTARQASELVETIYNHPATSVATPDLSDLLSRIDHSLSEAQRDSESVRANLTEVLMAQSYQDLSGQIIRGVITLVGEVERTLAHVAALAGDAPKSSESNAASQTSGNGFGPAIPGLTVNAVGEQGDVDALLADLGM